MSDYQSTHTGTEIDKAIDGIQNPNLLINPDFKVNQRGNAIYIHVGTSLWTADKWKLVMKGSASGAAFNPSNGALDNSAGTDAAYVIQGYPYEKLAGKKVSISGLIDGTRVSATATIPATAPTTWTLIVTATGTNGYIRITCPNTTLIQFECCCNAGKTAVFNELKFEIGSCFSGYTPTYYNDELRKCLPYYQKIVAKQPCYYKSNTECSFYIHLDEFVERTACTVSLTGNTVFKNQQGTEITPTATTTQIENTGKDVWVKITFASDATIIPYSIHGTVIVEHTNI